MKLERRHSQSSGEQPDGRDPILREGPRRRVLWQADGSQQLADAPGRLLAAGEAVGAQRLADDPGDAVPRIQ